MLNKILVSLTSLIILCSVSGCFAVLAGGAVGAGTATYVAGNLTSNIPSDIDTTWGATRDAVDELRLTVESAKQDATVGKLNAKNAAGTSIWINLKRLSPRLTEFSVRVGLLGDRDQSELILKKVTDRLEPEETR